MRKWRNSCLSPTYNTWKSMIARCNHENHTAYHNYGGRGITVCERWMNYDNFHEDMGERDPDLTLERIDNSKGYYKENCRWATITEQHNNERRNVILTHNGVSRTVAQWADFIGIKSCALYRRLKVYGWSLDRALQPIKPYEIKHGTKYGYEKGCRCDECRLTHNARMRAARERRRADGAGYMTLVAERLKNA